MLFKPGYLKNDEEKALAALAKAKKQEDLVDAAINAKDKVRKAALDRLDQEHLLIALEKTKTGERCGVIERLTDQEALLGIVRDSSATSFERAAAIERLDEEHTDNDSLLKIAVEAKQDVLWRIGAEAGKAAVKKLTDQETVLQIALNAADYHIAEQAAEKLEDRERILRLLAQTEDERVFRIALKKTELTGEEKQELIHNAKLKSSSAMQLLMTNEEMLEKCLEEKDAEQAKNVYQYTWDPDKMEQLKEMFGNGPYRKVMEDRIETEKHMRILQERGFASAVFNEENIGYLNTLREEKNLLETVKDTVTGQGRSIPLDDIYEKSGDKLQDAVLSSCGLSMLYFLGGQNPAQDPAGMMMASFRMMGPSVWLSSVADKAILAVVAGMHAANRDDIVGRIADPMPKEDAANLIHELFRTWYSTI